MNTPTIIDQRAVVDAYVNDTTLTVKQLAERFSIKPPLAASILTLHNVPMRRGASGGPSEIARQKAREILAAKGLQSGIARLAARYGAAQLREAVANYQPEQAPPASIQDENDGSNAAA